MFAAIHFAGYFEKEKPCPPFRDVRVFATLAEARAYSFGHLDAHDFDDVAYTVRIYDQTGRYVDEDVVD